MMPRVLFLLGIMLSLGFPVRGSTEEALRAVPEYTMKAAYLYNFAQLTDWPEYSTADGAFNLCIYGHDDFGSALSTLRGKTINMQELRLRRVTDVADARLCHLLFVGDSEGARGARLLEALRTEAVLTVTDNSQIALAGAILLIRTDDQRLSFDVNLDAAKRAHLKFSSKLLRLAKRVTGE